MATLIVDRGLQIIGDRASKTSGFSSTNEIQVMSVDDKSTAFQASDNSCGNPTNFLDKSFDSVPTRSGQTISHVTTFTTGEANFTIKRIALHNDTTTNVTGSSSTLIGGVDSLTIEKTSSFSLKITVDLTYANG